MSRAARATPLLLLMLVLVGACGVTRVVTTGPRPGSATRTVLPNGVRVISQEQPSSDVVAVQLWVEAGGRDEGGTELGLAHYLEDMLFKGTATRPTGSIERDIEGAGGRLNAATSWDFTFYHVVVPRAQAVVAIETLADIAVNATLDDNLLETEKKIVLQEMQRAEDDPRSALVRRLYEMVFEGHPYGRPLIGTPGIIRGLDRSTLVDFYRRHYRPEAFTLVAVGAIDSARVVEAARRTLGPVPRSGRGRLGAAAPPEPVTRRREMVRPGSHAYLGLAWSGPRIGHADAPAMDILVSLLAQARTSRLTRSLQERLALVNSIGGGYAGMEAAGIVTVTAQLAPGDLAAVEREVLGEIRRLREAGVAEPELRRAVVAAEARHQFSVETAEGRARALGGAEATGSYEEELAYLDRIRAVTREHVQAVARRYLDPERYTRLAFVPPAPS